MRVGIIDADLIGRDKHRFPNLACEKISGFWKDNGAEVDLLLDYSEPEKLLTGGGQDNLETSQFDVIYISKVFTDTEVPTFIRESDNVHIGGTGFYFDQAPPLPNEIEHHKPDYNLYDKWIESEVYNARIEAEKKNKSFNEQRFLEQFKEYKNCSIGFITRGCFRKCGFCVNKKYDRVFLHSPIEEFFDPDRKEICLLDDNVLGCPHWNQIIDDLNATGKTFYFKQGMDERILSDKKCEALFNSNHKNNWTFAFDNISDYDLIHKKLKLIRKHTQSISIRFYVLVGFEGTDVVDIINAFLRIELLMKYGCLPYIMRYQNKNEAPWKQSKYRGMYITLARWCNQPSMFRKKSFREFCESEQGRIKTNGHLCSSLQYLTEFENEYPNIAKRYFDMKFYDLYNKTKEEEGW